MNRRQFIDPRQISSAAAPIIAIADELHAEPPSTSEPVHLRFSRRAMATTFEVILPFDAPAAHENAPAMLDEIDRLESQLTVYQGSSEVSRLNARAADQPVRVDRSLFELLSLAKRIHDDTDSAFDISVGALIKTWGFYRRQGRVPTERERDEIRQRIGMNHVELDDEQQSVRFKCRGLEINLGSIGKGYALDRAAALATSPNLLLHGGHSSVLALGDEAPGKRGWTIGLTDPEKPQCRRGLVHLRNRAMATSAITFQNIEHKGRKLGHLLDPRTAWPAEGMLMTTVTAPTAAEADALATAFFILGVEKSREYCERHPAIGAALIATEKQERIVLLGRAIEEVEVLR